MIAIEAVTQALHGRDGDVREATGSPSALLDLDLLVRQQPADRRPGLIGELDGAHDDKRTRSRRCGRREAIEESREGDGLA